MSAASPKSSFRLGRARARVAGAALVLGVGLGAATGALAFDEPAKLVGEPAPKAQTKTVSAPFDKAPAMVEIPMPQVPAIASLKATNGVVAPRVRAAYDNAIARANAGRFNCGVRFAVLAAIGQTESGNGLHVADAVIRESDGLVYPPVFGPMLNGTKGQGRVRDTDGGLYDGDATWDRAVGPMQFMPETWARLGTDANDDGVADPQSIDDAALTTLKYLCRAAPGPLTNRDNLAVAYYSYNHSDAYVAKLLAATDALEGR